MNFIKEYNNKKQGQRSIPTLLPYLSCTKTGVFYINKAAVRLIGLRAGDLITVAQSSEDLDSFYIYLSEDGMRLRQSESNLLFTCKSLFLDMNNHFKLNGLSFRMQVFDRPIQDRFYLLLNNDIKELQLSILIKQK